MAIPTPAGSSDVPDRDAPMRDVPEPEVPEQEAPEPAVASTAETTPSDSKPVDSKPVDSKPVDSEPVDFEPVDSDPDESVPASPPAPHAPAATAAGRMSPRAKRAALVAAAAAVVALMFGLIWQASHDDDPAAGGSAPAASQLPAQFGPTTVDVASLRAQQSALARPIYWAGDPGAKKLELTVTADGGNMLRYLSDENTDASSARAVAMYPMTDAYSTAASAGRRVGAITHGVAGGLVVGNTDNAYNGYLALKDLPYLIEVFDPKPGQAWRLLTAGKIVPVPS